jgi:murein DD-endopeptidase MepM/ murein hydrolase activator NlpD
MVALSLAAPVYAETGAGSGGVGTPLSAPESAPVLPAEGGSGGIGQAPGGLTPARPVLTLFNASPASASAAGSGAVVRFRVRDRARSVRVRLAFVSLADGSTYRVNLGRRRTGRLHTYTWSGTSNGRAVPAGSYRVRITAGNPRGKRAVRATTVQVVAAVPTAAATRRFPVAGPYSYGGADGRFGAPRSGRTHQGQDIAAAEGTPVVAPNSGTVGWRAYQADGAGYYLVLDGDGENYNYVFMHLQRGSLLVSRGDRVTAGQRLAGVGNTGRSFGAHLHFEIWDGPWYAGGHPVDPLPFLKAWE